MVCPQADVSPPGWGSSVFETSTVCPQANGLSSDYGCGSQHVTNGFVFLLAILQMLLLCFPMLVLPSCCCCSPLPPLPCLCLLPTVHSAPVLGRGRGFSGAAPHLHACCLTVPHLLVEWPGPMPGPLPGPSLLYSPCLLLSPVLHHSQSSHLLGPRFSLSFLGPRFSLSFLVLLCAYRSDRMISEHSSLRKSG